MVKWWVKTESDEKAVRLGYRFDEKLAEQAASFFPKFLRHSKAPWDGKPFELLDWEYQDIVAPLWGWIRPDGTRRFRRAYIEVPKKNGKTQLASGIALKCLCEVRGAHVYSAAASRDQASLCYDEAANMVEASPELLSAMTVRRSTKTVFWTNRQSHYRAIAADAGRAEGKDATAIICDELHAWRNRDFFESLIYAGRARPNHLFFIITTAGDDVAGICWEEHRYAEGILDGSIEDLHRLAVIYAADNDEPWDEEETWKKANPSYGITIVPSAIKEECNEAKDNPARENAFRRYTLNQWIGSTNSFISLDAWTDEKASTPFEIESLRGLPAWCGVDLSCSRDLSAVVWCVRDADLYYLVPRIYVPRGQILVRERSDHQPYRAWARDGHIRECAGETIDYSQIRRDILEDSELFDVQIIGYDPYNAEYLCNQQLSQQDGFVTVPFTQSMSKMSRPTQEFVQAVNKKMIRHGGHRVLQWMVSGAVAYEDSNNNIRPIKRNSISKIDGVIAAIMAFGLCAEHTDRGEIWREKGALIFEDGQLVN